MCTTAEPITIYQIIKDLIIPGLGVLSTITIGVVIAIFIRKREESSKIKSLLIDSYMEYLNKRTEFAEYESIFYTHEILKDIYINYSNYFNAHSNSHIPKGIIKTKRDFYRQKLNDTNQENSNWSPYTYKFCFLLGTKTYNNNAQKLDNEIVTKILSEKARLKLISDIKTKIISDKEIQTNMNTLNSNMIENGIDMMIRLISSTYYDYQLDAFKEYDNLIADLIDKK